MWFKVFAIRSKQNLREPSLKILSVDCHSAFKLPIYYCYRVNIYYFLIILRSMFGYKYIRILNGRRDKQSFHTESALIL